MRAFPDSPGGVKRSAYRAARYSRVRPQRQSSGNLIASLRATPEVKIMQAEEGQDAAAAVSAVRGLPTFESIPVPRTSINRIHADGVSVFYREAGQPDAPVALLLHGFPASSFQYRELIPRLADRYRVIAPDLPGFGFTEVPENRQYKYSFDAMARTILAFTDALSLKRYALYVFDYGAPTGFRLAMARPERVTAIISQNGNAYEEGLGDAWAPIQRYWREPTFGNRETVRKALSPEGLRWQYTAGVLNPDTIAPEGYTLDAAMIQRPGNMDIQLDLFLFSRLCK
jgi:pimeloyl-ACP methyl ester carboxylesterase